MELACDGGCGCGRRTKQRWRQSGGEDRRPAVTGSSTDVCINLVVYVELLIVDVCKSELN